METEWRPSLLAYDLQEGTAALLVAAEEGSAIYSVAVSPDTSKIVYCVRDDDGLVNLRLIDLSAEPATDTALTTDGKSCTPSF